MLQGISHALRAGGLDRVAWRQLAPEAQDLLLKARFQLNKRTPPGFLNARGLFEKVIEQEPSSALAYSGLADAYLLLGAFNVLPPKELFTKAESAAQRAIQLDPTLSQPHAVLGYILADRFGLAPQSEREFKQAIDLDPGNATARQWYALCLVGIGRHDEAVSMIEQARDVDPLSPVLSSDVAVVYRVAGRRADEIAQLVQITRIHPTFGEAWRQLGVAYQIENAHRESAAAFSEAIRVGGETASLLAEMGYEHALSGDRARGIDALGRLQKFGDTQYVAPTYFAILYAALGDEAHAIEWIKKDSVLGPSVNAWQEVNNRTGLTEFAKRPGIRALPEPR